MTKPIVDTADAMNAPEEGAAAPAFRSNAPADRFMRAILRVSRPQKGVIMGAHRAFRYSLIVSGVRCIITYLLVPILVPVLSFAGWVATPLSIALCTYAVINGVISVRRFWQADHQQRWMYTAFMGVVFLTLAFALVTDISRIVNAF